MGSSPVEARYDFLGEIHFIKEVQQAVGQLMYALREQNPNRRIVLFTEFIDLPYSGNYSSNQSLFSYYRRVENAALQPLSWQDYLESGEDYAKDLFEVLLKDGFEIYPLEDREMYDLIREEEGVLSKAQVSALAIMYRNKMWARVIESKMKEIRQQDPHALFVVYAGMGHTSWLMPYSLPKFFAREKKVVAEITTDFPSEYNLPFVLWDPNHPFFQTVPERTLFYWEGEDASQLGKYTGFYYALVLPE